MAVVSIGLACLVVCVNRGARLPRDLSTQLTHDVKHWFLQLSIAFVTQYAWQSVRLSPPVRLWSWHGLKQDHRNAASKVL